MRWTLPWGAVVVVCLGCGTTGGSTDPTAESPTDSETSTPTDQPTGTPNPTPQPSTEIRFVAMGDTGTGSTDQYAVADAIEMKCAADTCDFGVLLGDNFYPSGVSGVDDPQWQEKLEAPYANLDFPFYMILGNHDYGGDGAGYEFDLGINQVAYADINDKWILPAEYYAFEEGAATFLGLGTNLIFWNHNDNPTTQGDFFTQALADSTQPWRIAIGHHPYISNGPHGNAGSYDNVPFIPIANGEYVKAFFDDYMCGNVDLYLSGHDHSRQILEGTPECDITFVVSGAGAKSTDLPGTNATLFEEATEGFAYIIVTDEKITIEMYGMDGSLEYTHEMVK